MSRFHPNKPGKISLFLVGLILAFILYAPAVSAQENDGTVYGVLFFSPSCGHCHKVVEEDLPPLMEHYSDQFVLMFVDVSTQEGSLLFSNAIERFQVSPERRGVPMLIVGDTVLVGSYEIPTLLPGIIDTGITEGGIPWPDLPGLEVNQQVETIEQEQNDFWKTFNQDRTANFLSVFVLAWMVLSVIWIGSTFYRRIPPHSSSWPDWVIPVLSTIGLLIAAYLSYIEISQTEAICGPVGNCNAVQSSSYARLFGLIPIGVLGLVGYLAILSVWLFQSSGKSDQKKLAATLIWSMAIFGTLFSIYLTFLEPFVIGATCMWCITSAVIMTILLWASSGPAMSFLRLKTSRRRPYQTISRKKV